MFECDQCGGTGYITYQALYCEMKMNDYRACDCVNRFLKNATPVEVLGYIREKIKGSKIIVVLGHTKCGAVKVIGSISRK